MEQQTLSVAKAGLVCKLNTRTTILAATNPKGQFDPEQSLSVNVALASPLLSRFDIIMVLLDNQNPEWDRKVSDFILGQKVQPGNIEAPMWTLEKLQVPSTIYHFVQSSFTMHFQAYISFVKSFRPALTRESELILTRYYQVRLFNSDGHIIYP